MRFQSELSEYPSVILRRQHHWRTTKRTTLPGSLTRYKRLLSRWLVIRLRAFLFLHVILIIHTEQIEVAQLTTLERSIENRE